MLGVLPAAAISSPAPSPSSSPSPQAGTSWLNVTMGEPASAVRAPLGDPLRIVPFEDGTRRIGRYALPGANGFIFVIEERGYVIGLAAFTTPPASEIVANVAGDPNGVKLGEDESSVTAMHLQAHAGKDRNGNDELVGHISPTAGFSYSFERGKVSYIQWGALVPADAPTLDALTLPLGDSPATAILDNQSNETDGVAWEYKFLGFHPCDGQTTWKLQTQSLIHDGARSYDRLHVVCPTTKAERDFYFDVTAFFGKL